MTSNLLKGLLIVYVLITLSAIYEKKWPMVLYWISACGLQLSILWGMK